MELSMSGNALKTFNRCVMCLSRVGTELVFQASPSQLELHTLNTSRSAYQSISLTPSFFDTYSVSSSNPNPNPNGSDSSPDPLQCSVLLKAVQSVLRTPAVTIDQLSLTLPSPDASKLMFSLHCTHGVKKTYWITCNAEPEIQHLSLDKTKFPSSLVVRPRDLARLLSNFQSSLHEISIIATDTSSGPSDPPPGDLGGKAVELRSYIDPSKEDSDARLHTQLWIDPVEEFLQYTHVGDPVDVTFGVKELKAFLAFCEGCEVDIHQFFEKAGEPILMAPRFGLDDGSSKDFDASLVLATMLVSQLTEGNNNNNINNNDNNINNNNDNMDQVPVQNSETVPENTTTEHTKIWSELSGSGIRNSQMNRENPISSVQKSIQGLNVVNAPQELNNLHHIGVETDHVDEPQVMEEENNYSQHHPSNWIGDKDNDDDEDEELYVQSTPQYYD